MSFWHHKLAEFLFLIWILHFLLSNIFSYLWLHVNSKTVFIIFYETCMIYHTYIIVLRQLRISCILFLVGSYIKWYISLVFPITDFQWRDFFELLSPIDVVCLSGLACTTYVVLKEFMNFSYRVQIIWKPMQLLHATKRCFILRSDHLKWELLFLSFSNNTHIDTSPFLIQFLHIT